MFALDDTHRCTCHGELVKEIRNNADYLMGWVVEVDGQYVEMTYRGLDLLQHQPYGTEFTVVNAEDAHNRVWDDQDGMYRPGRTTYLDAVMGFLDHLTSDTTTTR